MNKAIRIIGMREAIAEANQKGQKAEQKKFLKELNKEYDYVETSTDFTKKEKSAIHYTIGRIQTRIREAKK